jgi:hypothetical protein
VAADHRSALPRVPGIPWWAAAILAAIVTAIGVALDAGSGTEALGGVFAACYVLGCLAAVLAVRQSGVFTAVIQPPLILFIAVPLAYFVFHGSTFTGIKDTLINCGYPLIERFPLMFFTSATVLLIGMIRWYLGAAAKRAATLEPDAPDAPDEAKADVAAAATPAATETTSRRKRSSTARAARATAAAAAAGTAADAMTEDAPRSSRRTSRNSVTGAKRSDGAAAGTGSRRSRQSSPPDDVAADAAKDRPRRRNTPPVDSPAEPRRRPRSTGSRIREPRELREPREPRDRRPLPPLDRRSGAQERYDRPQRRERPEGYERSERQERRRRSVDYEPHEPPSTRRTNGTGTHHPVSRVRYRGSDDDDSRTEHRSRPRHSAPDDWEYDL